MNCKQLELFSKPVKKATVKFVTLKMVAEDTGFYSQSITNSKDVISIVKSIFQGSYCEIVVVVCLNNRNHPTAISVVNVGSVNQSMVSPGNVFKLALTTNATSFILLHNHPGGGALSPSNADKDITQTLQKGGKLLEIELLDHLIVDLDCTSHYSFRDHNLL